MPDIDELKREQTQPTEQSSTARDLELAEIKKQMEVDSLVADSIVTKARRLAAENSYEKVENLLAREAGIIEKETKLEITARELGAINAKNTEILARIAEVKAQVRAERQGLKADIKYKQDFELNFEASGSKLKKEQVEKELHWLFVKFAGQVYGGVKDNEAWSHVRRLEKLWLGLEKGGN